MRAIKLRYAVRTAAGAWNEYEMIVTNGNEWERIVNVIHENKDEYKVLSVEHI